MIIKVNGKNYVFDNSDKMSIIQLLDHLKLQSLKVVIEKNGVILDNSGYKQEELSDGDKLEIVQFVGGG
jgi:sulfur carrier protein